MLTTIQIYACMCVTILYFLLPAYLSNSSGLAFGGGLPMDFGKSTKKGVRLIGDGCTWRGLIAGTIVGIIVGALQGLAGPYFITNFGDYIFTPIITSVPQGIIVGFLLGFGALIGDAIGSFLKRRIGIGRGKPAPVLDQLDFLIVALIFASFVIPITLEFVIIAALLTLIIHFLANAGAYLLGIKDVWY
ncbi:MAG: CDP-2,3-bis-(O-geranylgeranyl)-sn-glycerol synthase [archaeon]|nr:CDP-2,3-bis-(O-geranylgeranyl)-sn-glycerol synthase [archaeon]